MKKRDKNRRRREKKLNQQRRRQEKRVQAVMAKISGSGKSPMSWVDAMLGW